MNYKHLQYFWATAKAGGLLRAAEQLYTTPQTLSGQIKLLEDRLGRKLFRKNGRELELTEDGRVALGYAEDIFTLGGELEAALRDRPDGAPRPIEFRVGVADSVAKPVAYRLLEPALNMPQPVHMLCHEWKFADLLAELALHRLDLVIADEPVSRRVSVQAFNHPLGSSTMSFFAAPSLLSKLEGSFPACLNGAPMLIPSRASSVRSQFDAWLKRNRLEPRVIGEFDDGALMKAFGREGRGVFISPSVVEEQTAEQYNVEILGRSDELIENFYAISVERRITHPCVAVITQSARGKLFGH